MAAALVGWRFELPIVRVAVALWLGLSTGVAGAQAPSGASVVDSLKEGGYVLVIRNAQSPEAVPEEGRRAPGNLKGEREIDAVGQAQVSVIAYALRELDIPVGQMLHGPAFRSRQSANYLGRGELINVEGLSETGDAAALKRRAAEAPPAGRNTVIVTHQALIETAFGSDARGIRNAETLVFRARDGEAELVARLTIEDWAKLAVK